MNTLLRTLLLLLTAHCTLLIANAQTNVSGGIYANTTWTKANSPYIVTDTVVVFPGYTLTIEPGVVVKFDANKRLEIRQARLIAEGTAADSITFTSNGSQAPGSWSSVYLNGDNLSTFSYCNFHYAKYGVEFTTSDSASFICSKFSYNEYGCGKSLSHDGNRVRIDSCLFTDNVNNGLSGLFQSKVSNSIFLRNTNGVAEQSGDNNVYDNCVVRLNTNGFNYVRNASITNCVIKSNITGIKGNELTVTSCLVDSNTTMGIDAGIESSVIGCQITNNGVGLRVVQNTIAHENIIENNSIGIFIYSYINNNIYCNRICNNASYNLRYYQSFGSNISIPNNYWCTTDSSIIASTIYDGYDNVNLGLVNFMPVDTGLCYFTGCNVSITATNVVNATCDTCHNGSASVSLAYASAPVTYTWNTSPLQTTATATGLAPGTYTVCIQDANACTACAAVVIDSTNCSGFSVSASAGNATCSSCTDGFAQVNVTGGVAPYSYTWYTSPIQTSATANGLPQGVYPVCVTDAYGCVACDTATVSVGNCSAYFNLYPDTVPHTYYAVNMASGNGALTYLWNWGDGTTDTGAYPSHTYAGAGLYTICLTITDAAGCSNTHCNNFYLQRTTNSMVYVNVVAELPTGIHQSEIENSQFTVFPNPATNQLNINLGGLQAEQVSIYNVDGKLVSTVKQPTNNSLDISGLANGVYIAEINVRGVVQRVRWVKI